MKEKEFNLLDEPWIRVIDFDCNTAELSLKEVLCDAHKYKDLCGELPTQNFAMMRLLLAVLQAVFSRYDTEGNESPFEDEDEALERWDELWNGGQFPSEVIDAYLEAYRERFYLFHPERPFYQTEHAKVGTAYPAAKLFGNLSESNNKIRLFPLLNGKEKQSMTYAEAARWLLYVNAYDDTSAKSSSEARKLSKQSGVAIPSIGIAWLGQLGAVSIAGNNLFETLMLNLMFLDYNGSLFENELPIWEREKFPDAERVQIAVPNNLSELYTLQSRRLYLTRENGRVKDYYVLGGDFFNKENSFIEPMTKWKNIDDKHTDIFVPQKHSNATQFWRDFSSLITKDNSGRKPGVIVWIDLLNERLFSKKSMLKLKIFSVKYGDKNSSVDDVFADTVEMHSALLSKMQFKWWMLVKDSVDFCETMSKKVWILAKNVNLADGGDFVLKEDNCSAKVAANKAKAEFYSLIDIPFRKWLCAIDPQTDDIDEKREQWIKQCTDIALKLGEKTVGEASPAAFFGNKKGSAAKAMNDFVAGVKTAAKNM